MNNSIFYRQYPTPLDRFIYPIYQDFQKLKDEINSMWVKTITNGFLVNSHNTDFEDNRIHVTKDGSVISSQRLVLDNQTGEKIDLYVKFFAFYAEQRQRLRARMITVAIAKEFPENAHSKKVFKQWGKTHREFVSGTIATLVVLLYRMSEKTLDIAHLIEIMNAETQKARWDIVVDNDFDKIDFSKGDVGAFEKHDPTERLISSFWNYIYLEMNRDE